MAPLARSPLHRTHPVSCKLQGLMLVGLGEEDVAAVRRWLQLMEPGFVVRCCPAAALSQAADSGGHRTGPLLLRQALLGEAAADGDAALTAATLHEHPWEAQPGDAPPVAFFSGMSGEETVAVMEGWAEHTGLAAAPAFASVTNAILGKPLRRLLADIVRAQAQAPPPGYDAEVIAEVNARAAAAAAAGPTRTAAAGGDGTAGGAASVAATVQGGETALRSKLADYVMLGGGGAEGAAVAAPAAPMSLDQLKEQVGGGSGGVLAHGRLSGRGCMRD